MHYIEYFIVRLIFGLFGNISFAAGKRFAWIIYIIVSKVIRYRRKIIIENLRLVYGEQLPMPLPKLISGIYKNFIYLWMEFLQLRQLKAEDFYTRFNMNGIEHIKKEVEKGNGVICLSGHYGNFEWLGQVFALHGFKVNGIAKRQSNNLVNDFIEKLRRTNGPNVIYKKDAMRDGNKALNNGELLAIIADQDARKRGVFVDFMGMPSSTPVGPAIYQMRSGMPIYLIISVRKDYGQFDTFIEHIYSGPKREVTDEEILKITQIHTKVIEEWIRKHPEQWFWMHKRWKTKPVENSK